MSPQVDAILRQIEGLNEADRLLLEQQLVERAESDWQREAELARNSAHERGIDQQQIDDAIRELRYGS